MSASFSSRIFFIMFCVSSAVSQPIQKKESAFVFEIESNNGTKMTLDGLSPESVVEFLKGANLPENDYAFIFNVLKRGSKIITELNPRNVIEFMQEFDLFSAGGREKMKRCGVIVLCRIFASLIESLTAGPKEEYVVPELPDNLRKELYSELRRRARWAAWTMNPIEKLLNLDIKEFLGKKGVYQDINGRESDTYAEAKKNIETHYGLWRWLLTTSNHFIIQHIRDEISNTRKKEIKYSALIASLFIRPAVNPDSVHVPKNEVKILSQQSRYILPKLRRNSKQTTVADQYPSQETEFLLGI